MKQNSTIFGYVATLLCILFFQFSSAQTVTVSDPTPGALTDYTFTYTLGIALPYPQPAGPISLFEFDVNPSGFPTAPAPLGGAPEVNGAYPNLLPVSLTEGEIVVKVNGVVKTLTTDYTVTFNGTNSKVTIKPLIDLLIGDEIEVTLKNVFKNPIGLGEYEFTWVTFHAGPPVPPLPSAVVETFKATYKNSINTIYMADTAPSTLTDYTFLYNTTTPLVAANNDRLFSVDKAGIAPAGYVDFATPGDPLTATNVVVEWNGTELTLGSDYNAYASATQIYIDALIDVPAGSNFKVQLKQLITNPTGGEYTIPFKTSTSADAAIDSFSDVVYVGNIIEVSDDTTNALVDYTFKYQIMTDIPSASNTRIFNLDLSDITPAYPAFVTGGTVSVELDGVLLDPSFYSFGVTVPDLDNMAITVNKQIITAGAKIVVHVNQTITNPSTLGDYDFTFKTGYVQVTVIPVPFEIITTFIQYESFQSSVTMGTLSSIDFDKEGFAFYPNPVNNMLHIKAPVVIKNVTVYNVVGQEVYNMTPNAMDSSINLASQAKGIYLVKLVSENDSTKTIKVIKN